MEYKKVYDEDTQYRLDAIDDQISRLYESYLYKLSHCRDESKIIQIKFDMQNDCKLRGLIAQRCEIESEAVPKIIIKVDVDQDIESMKERLGIKNVRN